MSADEKLLRFIIANEPDCGQAMGHDPDTGHSLWGSQYGLHASRLIDAYAHELAEKIRVAAGDVNYGDAAATARWALFGEAADLIDPEVS